MRTNHLVMTLLFHVPTSHAMPAPFVGTAATGVQLVDHGEASFKPFLKQPKDTIQTELPDNTIPTVGAGVFSCVSAAASIFLAGPWGAVAVGALEGIAIYFGSTAKSLDPTDIYKEIFGSIQQQINQVLNSQRTSTLTARLATLSSNANDEMVSYLALLGISENSNATMQGMMDGKIPIPTVQAAQVDLYMKGVDSVMTSSPDWFTSPSVLDSKTAFALTNVSPTNNKWCLHTENHNVNAGSKLLLNDDCDLNSVDDKAFVVESGTNRLLLRGATGDFCVMYSSGDGTDPGHNPLAIYPIGGSQCTSNKVVITAVQGTDQSWSIMDGKDKMCIAKDGHLYSPAVFQVEVPDFSGEGMGNTEADDFNPCDVKDWSFKEEIPIILNNSTQGGVSGQHTRLTRLESSSFTLTLWLLTTW